MKTQLPVDKQVETYHRLQRISGVLEHAVARSFASQGLTSSQFNTLRLLAEQGPLAQRDIADQLLKTGGNVTLVVDNLSARSLVERNRDTVDRRVIYVSLTEQGRKVFHELCPAHIKLVHAAIGVLSESELNTLIKILEVLDPEKVIAVKR